MIELCKSPYIFLKKILSEFIEIPDSSWMFFSESNYLNAKNILPIELADSLELSAFDFFYHDSMEFKFQFFQGTMKNIRLEMVRLFLDDSCLAIYLKIDDYSGLEPIKKWINDLNKFWVLEVKEALFFQESGLTLAFKIKPDFKFSFFALDEIMAMDVIKLLENKSHYD